MVTSSNPALPALDDGLMLSAVKNTWCLSLTSFQEASPAFQAAVPALVPELIATLHEAEAHRLPQRLCQTRLPATQPLLPPSQTHLLALLQVGLARRRFIGKRTR